ncbi:MAG TPA: DUF885 domain-containing protein [Dehalococcoidia bacterium]|nr:DUF885 domain-containing protein [Dehalococcoidia bacterium]
MSRIFEIADKYVEELAALDPSTATALGIPGHEREMPDYSPEGAARIAALNHRTLEAIEAEVPADDRERIAREFMAERLGVQRDLYEAGEQLRALRIIASPLQRTRSIFDDMPKATEDDWANIAARLDLVPRTLALYRQSLNEGINRGLMAAKRQALEGARQAETWSGVVVGEKTYFDGLLAQYEAGNKKSEIGDRAGLGADLERGVRGAKFAYAEMASFLRNGYASKASESEATGEDRYALLSRVFLGDSIDPKETYEWGWQELHEVEREMVATAERIKPGASVPEVLELLESDPARSIDGADAYRAWLQELHDQALADLHGTHFDIPEEIRRVEVMIPPPGSAAAAYYTGPSEDFKRSGRTWWPTMGRDRFPMWGEVTTAYHEGVPGHHLQVAGARCLGDRLSRYQRLLGFISGYGEGWALYAERLMGELGYLENPDYYMGLLSAQALRCVRVVIDIGMHLELKIPQAENFHPGETWNHDLAVEFSIERTGRPREFMASEVVRYLGWGAQAISYKVGEAAWLRVRESAKKKAGAAFDLKEFHSQALDLGPMGLAQLERELA